MDREHLGASGLLTRQDLQMLGNTLKRVLAVDDTDRFDELLGALDKMAKERHGHAAR